MSVKVNQIIKAEIENACATQGVERAAPAIVRLVEQHISRELPTTREKINRFQQVINLIKKSNNE